MFTNSEKPDLNPSLVGGLLGDSPEWLPACQPRQASSGVVPGEREFHVILKCPGPSDLLYKYKGFISLF
jgi:hypothetical protein